MPRHPDLSDNDYRAKIMSKVSISAGGCWEWQGWRHPDWHYGEMSYRGRRWRVHRLIYMFDHGPIQVGTFICHTCDNPPCCNPAHLWAGTHKDNMRGARKKRRFKRSHKTVCVNGHPLTPENVWTTKRNQRHCRACQRMRQRLKSGWPEGLARTAPLGTLLREQR